MRCNRNGLTLIELLVVLLFIGFFVSVLVPKLSASLHSNLWPYFVIAAVVIAVVALFFYAIKVTLENRGRRRRNSR